jgi:hypothetical protein
MDGKYRLWCGPVICVALMTFPLADMCYRMQESVVAEAIRIGDTRDGIFSFWHRVACDWACFPAFCLPTWVGDWMKIYITDNGVLGLYLGVNAVFWAFLIERVLGRRFSSVVSRLEILADWVIFWF